MYKAKAYIMECLHAIYEKKNGNNAIMNRYIPRVESKEWKAILLAHEDEIVLGGRFYALKGKAIGCGVVEVNYVEKV